MMNKRNTYLWLSVTFVLCAVVWIADASLANGGAFAFKLVSILVFGSGAALLFLTLVQRIARSPLRNLPEPLRGFMIFAAISVGTLVGSLLALLLLKHESYGTRDNVFGMIFLVFVVSIVIPLRGLYVSRKTPVGKRIVFYTASMVMVFILSALFVRAVGEYLDHRWYDAVMQLRGNRKISNPSVAILNFWTWPGERKVADLLNALEHSGLAAIVLPPGQFDQGDDESLSLNRKLLPMDKIVFNTYGWSSGQWTSVSQGYSTIEAGFPPGWLSLNQSMGIPMFCQPWDTWCKDLALAAIQKSNAKGENTAVTPELLGIPSSEKRRMLINHYVVENPLSRYVLANIPFPFLSYYPGHYLWKDSDRPQLLISGEAACFINAKERRLETYPNIRKTMGTVQYDEPDTTKPIPFVPKSLAGKILFLNLATSSNSSLSPPWKSEAFLYATITENILNRDFLVEPRQFHQFLASILLLAIIAALYATMHPWKAFGNSLVVFAAAGFALFSLFTHMNLFFGISWFAFGFAGLTAFLFPYELLIDRSKLLEERTRLQTELSAAHDMQMGLMPASDPVVQGFDISGLCRPADEVGGDYFDYVWLNDEKTKLGIAVADVSGKAMKAAITAVMTSGMVYREVGTNETPKSILRKINRPIFLKTDRRIFTAMSFAVIDVKSKTMTFSNAGQMQPLLKRNGAVESLKVDGSHLPLGMAEDVDYNETSIQLQTEDTLVFYTDGIPEAMNGKNEMFGFELLGTIVKESAGSLSAKQLATSIVEKVAKFSGSTKQHDDMTVVVVRVL